FASPTGPVTMHLLFIHQAFPAQVGRLALELTRRYGWQCSFVVRHLSSCPTPTPEMLQRLHIIGLPPSATGRDSLPCGLARWPTSWPCAAPSTTSSAAGPNCGPTWSSATVGWDLASFCATS